MTQRQVKEMTMTPVSLSVVHAQMYPGHRYIKKKNDVLSKFSNRNKLFNIWGYL